MAGIGTTITKKVKKVVNGAVPPTPPTAGTDYAIDTALKYGDANTANSVNAGTEPYINRMPPVTMKKLRKRNAFFGEL